MAFDKSTRNRLAKFVADARGVIADEFTQQFQSLYGISAKGEIAPLDKLGHLDESGLATAALLRERIDYLLRTHPDDKDGTKAAVARLAREQAFTILNRLAAIRMAEKRGLIVESVGQGYQSRGFKVFETVAGSALGDTYHRYRRYLFCLFDELAIDLGVLFDRRSPQALLFPREPALLALLDLLHAADLESLWAEDETIGWIYQYYNDPEERKKMRKESAAPRNSRELAVRNQFFTPRYVVEFLTDNTLGRIWYEMTKGQSRLKDQCRYLVRRPNEIFLDEGEDPPKSQEDQSSEALAQDELLKQPVHIPHRPLKDPREIRLLDPACGSMHFGLYAFDLFETIYEEAWDSGSFPALQEAYASRDEFFQDVPRLIIEHNIHGIDIDPRAVQIAGLSLWLRAQKAWQARGVKPADRPRVRRSNIVCAEPMPGSPEMLEEFVATLDPPLLGELVKTVFDKMQLAGEAGSLLKIEEEIRTAIDTARKDWLKEQSDLFSRKNGSQEEFFDTAEQQVIDALRAYAEQADTDSYQRRLFADDAARGFAFIDLCRKRYDAVVMNPPFGDASKDSKTYLVRSYPITKSDLYAAFVERGLHVIRSGSLGAITSRTGFFQSSFQKWRTQILLPIAPPVAVADLGGGVLDGAMVETAAYCLDKGSDSNRDSTFIRLGREEQKAEVLCSALDAIKSVESHETIFEIDPSAFQAIPGSPFAYWVPSSVRQLFVDLPPFEADGRTVKQGLATADDFRFVRTAWEVSPSLIASMEGDVAEGKYWFPYPKGGEFSPFYADIPLVVNWELAGSQYWHNLSATGGVRSNIWMLNESVKQFFFQPGLTYPRRLHRLAVMPMPTGSIISVRGSGIYGKKTDLKRIAGLFSSAAFDFLVKCMLGRFGHPQFDNGTLCKTPIPDGFPSNGSDFEKPVARAVELKRVRDTANELSHVFCVPVGKHREADSLQHAAETWIGLGNETAAEINELQAKIDDISYELYGFDQAGRNAVVSASTFGEESDDDAEDDDEESDAVDAADVASTVSSHFSHLLGTAFGRWDIRYATGERQPPELPDPFDPLPACPPGMLQNAEGLPAEPKDVPAEPKDVPADYPLRISWPGILVDDENHPEDIVARVREAIEVIWKDRAEAIDQEACGILGVKTLRDYFRRPAAFFADHLKRYSKSRRQAPIYWPLSTKSGSYTLWLYYHRITDQTLHTCLADFLDPKLRKVQSELDALSESGKGGTRAGELREFLDELHDLRDEIERVIKLPWKPNLNDGVLITASPLHKLFRLPKWQKDLKACWDKLAKGDYDWAHLAYTIWPERVEKVCEKDRSIAIAHGREDLCKVEPPKPKKKRAKKKNVSPDEEGKDESPPDDEELDFS